MPHVGEQCYRVRSARTGDDILAAQRLRQRCFGGAQSQGVDQDRFDAICSHLLVEEQKTGRLVACCRLLLMKAGPDIRASYSAQFYDLTALQTHAAPMLELGRFCIEPNEQSADILRLVWGALTCYVDKNGVRLLFGCSSFRGTDAHSYHDTFALMNRQNLAPKRWRPGVKAANVVRFAQDLHDHCDERQAKAKMPPLLRSYLAMGGWVSDHAVIDRQMNSFHVFTGLEVAAIPAGRARLLRAGAQSQAMV